jgi:hypothetical protein
MVFPLLFCSFWFLLIFIELLSFILSNDTIDECGRHVAMHPNIHDVTSSWRSTPTTNSKHDNYHCHYHVKNHQHDQFRHTGDVRGDINDQTVNHTQDFFPLYFFTNFISSWSKQAHERDERHDNYDDECHPRRQLTVTLFAFLLLSLRIR